MDIKKITKTLNKIMIAIFIFILVFSLFMGTSKGNDYQIAFIYALILSFLSFYSQSIYEKTIKKWGSKKTFLLLTLLCIIVKFAWVIIVRTEPAGDYATFYYFAESLSKNWIVENRYVALFPHIFGYSNFLSIFIKIFGTSFYLAPILNVIMTVITGMVLFRIGSKLINLQAGSLAYLLWIICPSQTIYNSLALSEPLYTMLIVSFVLLIVEYKSLPIKKTKKDNILKILIAVVAGICLRLINMCRPIAIILLIALIIWIFVLNLGKIQKKEIQKKWIPLVIIVSAIYIFTGSLWNKYISTRLNEVPASTPGFTILVGTNMDSYGIWNLADAELLQKYNTNERTAEEVQQELFTIAKNRVLTEVNIYRLGKYKIQNFLGSDDMAVNYNSIEDSLHLRIICNTYFYLLLIISIIGATNLFKNDIKNPISIVVLFVIGLTIAQLLVEVALRYHYSMIPMLILIAQYAFFKNNKLDKEVS